MEQDKLELCAATLQDYVEGKFVCTKLSVLDILHQSTAGVELLHSLDIGKVKNILQHYHVS
jgi:serine/threonine-protein kinase/endoribonuclease IRE1